MPLSETQVIIKTHRFLEEQGLLHKEVVRLYTDEHPKLKNIESLEPYRRFYLKTKIKDSYPDLVGQLSDGETIFAVEAKGAGAATLMQGLAQAENYKEGFHCSFLAADASAINPGLVEEARRKQIGVIAVNDGVKILNEPSPYLPRLQLYKSVMSQMDNVWQASIQETFQYNAPTHYLVWPIVLEPDMSYPMSELPTRLGPYPIPQGGNGWRDALSGAQKLGLVRLVNRTAQLTHLGAAVKELLVVNIDVNVWSGIHKEAGGKGSQKLLCESSQEAAAVLRILVFHDPMVRLLVEVLELFPNSSGLLVDLAMECDKRDHERSPFFFLQPDKVTSVMDDQSRIKWNDVPAGHFRTKTYYQYKKILTHAGLLQKGLYLCSSSSKYRKERDVWTLK